MTFSHSHTCTVRIGQGNADPGATKLTFDGSLSELNRLLPLALSSGHPFIKSNSTEPLSVPFAIGALYRIEQPKCDTPHTILLDQRHRSSEPGSLERVLAYCAKLGRGSEPAALLLYDDNLGEGRVTAYLPQGIVGEVAETISEPSVAANLFPQAIAIRLHKVTCDPADIELSWSTLMHAIELDVFYTDELARLQISLSPEYFSETDGKSFEQTIRGVWEGITTLVPEPMISNSGSRRTEFIEQVLANCLKNAGDVFIVDSGRNYSWRDFHQRAFDVAYSLLESSDSSPYVAVLVRPGFDFVTAVFGAIFAGKAYVPIVDKLGDERITYILEHSNICTLIIDASHQLTGARLEKSKLIKLLKLDDVSEQSQITQPPVINEATNVIYRMFTSGSTGNPKAVDVSFSNYLALVDSYTSLLPDFSQLNWSFTGTPVFDSSTKQYLFPALNGTQVIVPAISVDHNVVDCVNELIERGVNVLNMTPALIQLLLEQEVPITSFNYILTGGEALSVELYDRILVATGKPNLMNMYGPTEVTVNSTGYIGDRSKHFLIAVPIGRAILGAQGMVVDKDLIPLRAGYKGELLLNGPLVTAGYPADSEKTAEKFVLINGAVWYRTGDQVVEWFDGNLYYFGRDDNQIKLNGVRIELGEIRSKLAGLCDTPLVDVLLADQRLIAVYKRATPFSKAELNHLRESAKAALASFVQISQFLCVADVPLTVQGKIDTRQLRQLADKEMTKMIANLPSLDPQQRLLIEAINTGLSARQSGMQYDPTVSLYEQGTDSLSLLRILLEIEHVKVCTIGAQALYHAPDFAAIEVLIEARASTVTDGWERASSSETIVILFPPVLGDAAIFRNLVDDPTLANFAFVTSSYPGMTLPLARPESIMSLSQQIANEIEHGATGKRVILVGYSMGCIVAAETMRQLSKSIQVEHLVILDKGPLHNLLTPTFESQLQDSLRFLDESIANREGISEELLAHMRSYVLHNTTISYNHQMNDSEVIAEAAVCFMCTRDGESFRDTDWKPYFSKLELVRINCGHGDILQKPWVESVATVLRNLVAPQQQ